MDICNVRILKTTVTAQYGTLTAGEVLRTNIAFAKHLVEDCRAATFIDSEATKAAEDPKAAEDTKKAKATKSAE